MGSAIINTDDETYQLVKQLAERSGMTIRRVTQLAFKCYEREQGTVTAEEMIIDELLKRIDSEIADRITVKSKEIIKIAIEEAIKEVMKDVRKDVCKKRAYKPWLRRSDADDIKEFTGEGGTD